MPHTQCRACQHPFDEAIWYCPRCGAARRHPPVGNALLLGTVPLEGAEPTARQAAWVWLMDLLLRAIYVGVALTEWSALSERRTTGFLLMLGTIPLGYACLRLFLARHNWVRQLAMVWSVFTIMGNAGVVSSILTGGSATGDYWDMSFAVCNTILNIAFIVLASRAMRAFTLPRTAFPLS